MPVAAEATGLLAGLLSVTAKDVGKKVGITLLADMFTEPAEFFLKMGLSELFGGGSGEQFKEIFEKLDQLEHEVEAAVGQISVIVQESELEEEHARIATYFSNLQTAAMASTTITAGYEGAYNSFFAPNTAEILDQINRDTQQVRDRIVAKGAISNAYLDTLIENLYHSNADMYEFDSKLRAIAALYIQDLTHAGLVLSCILLHATDPLHKAKAEELIKLVNDYQTTISEAFANHLRDIPTIAVHANTIHFLLRNKSTDQVLGRYADTKYHSRSIISRFELHAKDDGYYYLKVPGHDVGIDHYYGRDIRPVRNSDSTHPNHLWRFDPAPSDPTRYFRIVNRATGAALDHYHGRSLKGAPVDEHPNHLWEVLPDQDGNTCCIANKATGGLLGYDAHYTVEVGHYNPTFAIPSSWNNVIWQLNRHDSESYHNLVNVLSGEAVDHYDGESFRFVGSPSTHPNHLWRVEPTKEGETQAYHFVRNKATSQVLDHYYGKSLGGAGDSNAEGPNACHIWRVDIQ